MSFSETPELLDAGAVLALAPVVPVITITDIGHALPLAQALVAGGLPVLEVTLRTTHGLDAIEAIASEVPGALVGAGTVRSADEFTAAVDAGSRFVVSPGLTDKLLARAGTSPVPLVPGVATAGELMRAREAGLTHVKFFPAETAGGVAALRALCAPFPDMRFCPTGGVKLSNLADYLAVDAVVTVGGTWMTPAGLLESGDWSAVEQLAREAAEAVRSLRTARK
ncbi:MAG: bifunctional 4-hydroxy-2-oxoglutarate aldolase/2-dehydro-3-deoxy-phosphogluconate aldolase [Pseudomonadota bacterium]